MQIKICGPGCASCAKAEALVKEVVAEAGITANVTKITDFVEMAQMGVLSTPAIVVNDKVKCVGRVPSKDEIWNWIRE